MTDHYRESASSDTSPREDYMHRANPAFDAAMTARTATHEAAFFLPHLRPGLRLLDVGCGPGTITLGLAGAVALGEVVGLDLRPEAVDQARTAAAERGVANVRFEVGSAYALPFPDASFAAAFAHIVLMHLREPGRALAERRVLPSRKPGIAGTALAEGWADQATLDAMLAEFDAWAERPDAFLAAV